MIHRTGTESAEEGTVMGGQRIPWSLLGNYQSPLQRQLVRSCATKHKLKKVWEIEELCSTKPAFYRTRAFAP